MSHFEDDSKVIAEQTWIRNVQMANKVGYMDGATDGQAAVFQCSFDLGYELGLNFGMKLGYKLAMQSEQHDNKVQTSNSEKNIYRHNCRICANLASSQDSISNLYRLQKECNHNEFKKFQE